MHSYEYQATYGYTLTNVIPTKSRAIAIRRNYCQEGERDLQPRQHTDEDLCRLDILELNFDTFL